MLSNFMAHIMGDDGQIMTDPLVEMLRITKVELAKAIGLPTDAVSKKHLVKAQKTQTRLRELSEILNRVFNWTSSVPAAFAWYRSQPIPSFGDQTAEDLLKQGKAELIREYLSRINVGGYA